MLQDAGTATILGQLDPYDTVRQDVQIPAIAIFHDQRAEGRV